MSDDTTTPADTDTNGQPSASDAARVLAERAAAQREREREQRAATMDDVAAAERGTREWVRDELAALRAARAGTTVLNPKRDEGNGGLWLVVVLSFVVVAALLGAFRKEPRP